MQGTKKTCKPCRTEKNRKRREQQRKKNKAARPTFMDGQYQTRPYQLVRKCGHGEIGWANATTLLEARHGAKGHVMIISRHRDDAHVGGHSAQAYYYCGCAKHPSKESRASPAQRAAHDQERNLSGQAVSTNHMRLMRELLEDNKRREQGKRRMKRSAGNLQHTPALGCPGAVTISRDGSGNVTYIEAAHSAECVTLARDGQHAQDMNPDLRAWIKDMFVAGVGPRAVHNAIHQKNVNVDPAKGLLPPRPPQPFAIDGDVTTAADHTAAQPPSRRWFPTYRTVRRVYEEHLASLNLHPDDIQAIAQLVGDMKTDGVLLPSKPPRTT
jgi:hypothetical protein